MRKWTRPLPLAIAILAVAAITSAQPPRGAGFGPGGPGRPPGPPLERLLNLTAAQQAQVKALREAEHAAMKPIAETARPHHEALQALLDDESPSAESVGQQVIALNNIQKQMKDLRDGYHEKLLALLTPEQQEKLKEFESKRPEHGPGGPPFGPFGPPPMPR